jgi:predicted choloylglycine hydrolase
MSSYTNPTTYWGELRCSRRISGILPIVLSDLHRLADSHYHFGILVPLGSCYSLCYEEPCTLSFWHYIVCLPLFKASDYPVSITIWKPISSHWYFVCRATRTPLHTGVNSGAQEGLAVSAPLVTPVVLMLSDTNIIGFKISNSHYLFGIFVPLGSCCSIFSFLWNVL